MTSTLSSQSQQLRIERAREKALRGIAVGINVLSTYDNTDQLYWQHINDVRKYITYRKIGVNKLPDVILRDFSSEHLDGFFRFAVGAMSLNLGDAANFNEEKKMDKIM